MSTQYRTKHDIIRQYQACEERLNQVIHEADAQGQIPEAAITSAVKAAVPWRKISSLVRGRDPWDRLEKGDLGLELDTLYDGCTQDGLSEACSVHPLGMLAAGVILLIVGTTFILNDQYTLTVACAGLWVLYTMVCRNIARERGNKVKQAYTHLLHDLGGMLAIGQERPQAYIVEVLLYHYTGLRFAGYEQQAEGLLPLFRLALRGCYVHGFIGPSLAVVSWDTPVYTEAEEDLDYDTAVSQVHN